MQNNSCSQEGEVKCIRGPSFFLLDFCCSHFVPMKFSLSSQNVLQVPNVFPNMFPRATHFIPYSLA
jgi:hypothetical protein